MSFLSGIGNIFHSIGSFFSGGDDEEQKKKQQQMQLGGPAPISRGPTQAPLFTPPGAAPSQPQKQDPLLTLFQPNGNTPLVKANPNQPRPQIQIGGPQTPEPAPTPPPKPHASIIHDITHNPITDVAGSLVKLPVQFSEDYSNTFANLGNRLAGGKNQTIEQNMGGDPFSTGLVKWSGATGKNAQLLGDTAQIGLLAASPGIESGISGLTEAGANKFLTGSAEDLIPAVTKYGSRFLTGGAINTAYSGANELGAGEDWRTALKKAPGNFAVGGVIGEAAPPIFSGLRKVTGAMGARLMSAIRGDTGVAAPDELATGVKSANPTQAADAAKVHGDNLAQEQAGQPQPAPVSVEPSELQKAAGDINTPAYQRAPLKVAAAAEADAARTAQEQAVAPDAPTDTTPAYQHQAALSDVIKQADQELTDYVNEHPEATPQDIEAAKQSLATQAMAKIDEMNSARYGGAEAPAAAPTGAAVPTPSAPVEAAPAPAPQAAVPAPAGVTPEVPAVSTADLQPAAAPQPQAPLPEQMATPDQPGVDSGVPKNERYRDAVLNQTRNDHFKQALNEDVPTKDQPTLEQLSQNAKDVVAGKTVAQLINDYGRDESFAGNAQQAHEALEAVRVLESQGDPASADAAANALNAWNDFASRSGYGTRSTALAYQDMPTTMKVAYIQKLVARAGGEALTDADITRLTSAAELQTQFAKTAEDALSKVTDLAAHANEADPAFNQQMKDALEIEHNANQDLYDQNRIVYNIIDKNMPKSALGDRLSQSARTMMLSSVGGRVFALTGTGFNAANYLADKTLSGLYGRVINKVGGAIGKVGDTNAVETARPRAGTVLKGAVKGAKGLVRDVYGEAPVKSVEDTLKKPYDSEYSHDSVKYGRLAKITEPFRKVVKVGVGSHMALTKGIEDSAIESSARAAAAADNIPKSNIQGFVDYYRSHPPKAVADEARQAWLGVNNLHENGVSDALGKVADGLENLGGKDPNSPIHAVLKQVRTTIMPFTKYMGGFMDKMLTDRNVFYNAFRIARARSPQELADQFAHLTTNVAGGLGIGYLLAKDGIITNQDAHGNNYDGLYFHIGDRYIGVEWAGQFAAPIIMGAELHGAGQNPTSWPTNVINDLMKASGVAGTFGSPTGITNVLAGKGESGIPQMIGTAVRQHVPGFFGDINSFLNHGHLNPTGEAPLTKVTNTNPDTGRQVTDKFQTEVNKTKALIPGLSQELPRKAGEQAPDMIDRMLHSSHSSAEEKQAAVDQKAAADQATADKQAGIPNPAPGAYSGTHDTYAQALQATIERGEYDKTIESIKQDLAQKQNDKNVAPSTIKEMQTKIMQFGIAKNGGLNYEDMQLYNSTSNAEWRQLGNPKSETYDPEKYQKLWAIDEALGKAGVAGSFGIDKTAAKGSSEQKYKAKPVGTGSGSGSRSAASHAASLIKGNTVGSAPDLKNISFGDLSPVRLDNFKIPVIQKIPAGQLIKARTITVRKGV